MGTVGNIHKCAKLTPQGLPLSFLIGLGKIRIGNIVTCKGWGHASFLAILIKMEPLRLLTFTWTSLLPNWRGVPWLHELEIMKRWPLSYATMVCYWTCQVENWKTEIDRNIRVVVKKQWKFGATSRKAAFQLIGFWYDMNYELLRRSGKCNYG